MGPFLPTYLTNPINHQPQPTSLASPQANANDIAAQLSSAHLRSARLSAAPNNHLARPTICQQLQAQLQKNRFQPRSPVLAAASERTSSQNRPLQSYRLSMLYNAHIHTMAYKDLNLTHISHNIAVNMHKFFPQLLYLFFHIHLHIWLTLGNKYDHLSMLTRHLD